MLDIGWSELLVIGVVALVVVGPKDLPVMFKQLGRFTARARQMAREFQRAMESAADETGVKDVAKDLKEATSGMDRLKDAADKFEKWDPRKAMTNPGKAAMGAVMGAGLSGSAATASATAAPASPEAAATTASAAPAAAAAPVSGETKSDT
ncbi:Sec-independent protein translocase protein TatB [Falsigemmobacter intermedius]|uniref:Sec-independent protein translocase protein TatB n=1 Tax=Falsigemmobacter intermedius TaxID=1553448 RepID=A0A444M9I0_9RHOB|nr:Sec-independent protein translocase protein TatB [Falsigemmobacter intermedius]RWY39566.1 twin-arginine translocase subunit TatB [Falsigemmobacter intermedius]